MELGIGDNRISDYSPCNLKYKDHYLEKGLVENNPEFFEEITQKDYEILSVQNCLSDIILEFNKAGICIKRSDGCNLAATLSLGDCLKSGCKIFSIRRISDNEVFSVNDAVQLIDGDWRSNNCKITEIKIEKDNVVFVIKQNETISTYNHGINAWRKAKTPLFVTEDCVEIFEGDDYITLDPEDYSFVWSVADQESLKSNWLKFAKRESAEDYVLWNAPLLSLKDVASIYPGINKEHNTPSHQAEQLKALVKSKL